MHTARLCVCCTLLACIAMWRPPLRRSGAFSYPHLSSDSRPTGQCLPACLPTAAAGAHVPCGARRRPRRLPHQRPGPAHPARQPDPDGGHLRHPPGCPDHPRGRGPRHRHPGGWLGGCTWVDGAPWRVGSQDSRMAGGPPLRSAATCASHMPGSAPSQAFPLSTHPSAAAASALPLCCLALLQPDIEAMDSAGSIVHIIDTVLLVRSIIIRSPEIPSTLPPCRSRHRQTACELLARWLTGVGACCLRFRRCLAPALALVWPCH